MSRVKSFFFRMIPDSVFLRIKYWSKLGKKLNLKNPQTFNEKLQWIKLHDRKDYYTVLVDKYEVKNYISSVIGNRYVIPTIGIYNRFDDIDFDELPRQFVIKCTHDSGGLVVCEDKEKLNIDSVRKKIEKSLSENFYYAGREWPYKNVRPRIIIEKYMIDDELDELRDYKFFCFNGKVEFYKVDFNRFTKHQANYYDRNSRLLRFGEVVCPPDFKKKIIAPKNLNQMIDIAEKLSRDIPFVRVDLYDVNNRIFFGEMTFFPASGFGSFTPRKYDKIIGDLIDLDLVEK